MEEVLVLVLSGYILLHAGRGVSGSLPEIESGSCDVLTTSFTSLGNHGDNRYYYSSTPLSWSDANMTCRSYKDTYMATIPDEETKNFLVKKLAPIDRLWFGAQELKFNRWTWLNDNVYYGEVKANSYHAKNTCGFVNPAARDNFVMSPCYASKRFLCTDPAADPDSLRPQDVYVSNHLQAVTWYRARMVCLCRGLDLVVAHGNGTGFIYDLLRGETDAFWIGLQKTRYIWERTGEAMTYFRFDMNQPNNYASKQDCLDLHVDLFSDNDCAQKLPFVCMWENTTAAAEGQTQPQPQGVTGAGAGAGLTAALGWVLMAVVLVILVVVLVFVALRTRARTHGNTKQWWRLDNTEDGPA